MAITIPNNWRPRDYQLPAWRYLESGGKHAELIWHRRSGKDEVALHWAATCAVQRVATYWHMLPEAAQARKAIWNAVNPKTGIRRIDEAFPREIRASTNEQEMFIRFKNGSTWQVVGSDNYNSLVGSPPAGVTYSEWALANPSARAYLRPIILENNGWQLFITTPRGRNHAFQTYEAALKSSSSYAERLTAYDTNVFTSEQLEEERLNYIDDFGEDMGNALFEQEYLCSFDAAILGAYYGTELAQADKEGRIGHYPHDPSLPVHTAWDIGRTDDTAIWFYQVRQDGIHVVDFHVSNGNNLDYYHTLLMKKPFNIEWLNLPHDAKAKRLGMRRTVQEQLMDMGWRVRILPPASLEDGIQAARKTFPLCHFNAENCMYGLNALAQYQREWDEDRKCFRDKPKHDWTSHPADAFRYMAMSWRQFRPEESPKKPDMRTAMTWDEVMAMQPDRPSRRRI